MCAKAASRKTAPILIDSLLDAAETVIHRAGIGNLTLDDVAHEARVSKGGLLHHFPTKDRLLRSMVRRITESWHADALNAIDAAGPGPGNAARALIGLCLGRAGCRDEAMRRSSVVLVTALVNNPKLVAPLGDVHNDILKRVGSDGLPTGIGESIVLALNGLWFEWIFGLADRPEPCLSATRQALLSLVNASVCASVGSSESVIATPRRAKKQTKTQQKRSSRIRSS